MMSASVNGARATFKTRVVAVVKAIPAGKVMTYGMVARCAGAPKNARFVAGVLRNSEGDLPWHRVVNARGSISLAKGDGYYLQKQRLVAEGISFDAHDRIDLSIYT